MIFWELEIIHQRKKSSIAMSLQILPLFTQAVNCNCKRNWIGNRTVSRFIKSFYSLSSARVIRLCFGADSWEYLQRYPLACTCFTIHTRPLFKLFSQALANRFCSSNPAIWHGICIMFAWWLHKANQRANAGRQPPLFSCFGLHKSGEREETYPRILQMRVAVCHLYHSSARLGIVSFLRLSRLWRASRLKVFIIDLLDAWMPSLSLPSRVSFAAILVVPVVR